MKFRRFKKFSLLKIHGRVADEAIRLDNGDNKYVERLFHVNISSQDRQHKLCDVHGEYMIFGTTEKLFNEYESGCLCRMVHIPKKVAFLFEQTKASGVQGLWSLNEVEENAVRVKV
ncbi:choloylglycine hydrolase family Linear amide C-Nhydrolase [Striga asiatica]|uniref:Choloylglycine hydrolase family Linear amide C-Nhydrolase n=1 Tax=Striga asiatica TaxID=4170 RepID=A0A5A7PJN2_STRAF|nr:choloylglycine hydrolase family Linear amide C-Nhydrolase [Striga asiatica]